MKQDLDFGIVCMVLGYNTQYYAELENMAFDDMAKVAQFVYDKWLESDPAQYMYPSDFAFDYIQKTYTPTEDAE